MEILDEDHYGMKDVKDRIIEFIAVSKLRPVYELILSILIGPLDLSSDWPNVHQSEMVSKPVSGEVFKEKSFVSMVHQELVKLQSQNQLPEH